MNLYIYEWSVLGLNRSRVKTYTSNMSSVAEQKKLVEQLRLEYSVQRKPVSECVKEMMDFMNANNEKDVLLNGFPNKKDNPFMEKGGCIIVWSSPFNFDISKFIYLCFRNHYYDFELALILFVNAVFFRINSPVKFIPPELVIYLKRHYFVMAIVTSLSFLILCCDLWICEFMLALAN